MTKNKIKSQKKTKSPLVAMTKNVLQEYEKKNPKYVHIVKDQECSTCRNQTIHEMGCLLSFLTMLTQL